MPIAALGASALADLVSALRPKPSPKGLAVTDAAPVTTAQPDPAPSTDVLRQLSATRQHLLSAQADQTGGGRPAHAGAHDHAHAARAYAGAATPA